jgi:hypothetical protein
MTSDNNNYKDAIDNLESLAKCMAKFQSEEDQATIAWNLFYLKMMPMYGAQEIIH